MNENPERCIYSNEVRFGVVMYGGVSLAIYINGVANELYEMCCATPKVDGTPPPNGNPPQVRTRDVYRKLSWLLHNPDLRERYKRFLDGVADDPFTGGVDPVDALLQDDRTRFVVDVIAGTSAGGINGIFLAKALANGEQFAPLKKMWVQEGDIAKLLNDDRSWQGIKYAKRSGPPQSLLNSDRMYLKLVEAMQAMTDAAPELPEMTGGESVLSDELDLYVTTTDIRGAVVPLRLSDKVVYEKRHKQVYHFKYVGADGETLRNDFVAENSPFLSFSARCTSSFPFAFEPMQIEDAQRLNTSRPGGSAADFKRWKGFFTGFSETDMSSDRWRTRAFGDGGYLDNKPFSYVVEALSWRLASVPMDRKLIYVEPAPAHPERDHADSGVKPNAIENAVAALTHIPQYETIREDLQAVLYRNRRIERVERIVRRVEMDVAELADEAPFARALLQEGRAPDWRSLDLSDMIRYYGMAFLPYRRLRLTTVTDELADRLADRWGVDRNGDRLYAMRAIIRAWRDENYYEHKNDRNSKRTVSINAFLGEFDIRYRVRRASFILRKTHELMRIVAWLSQRDEGRRRKLNDTETSLCARLRRCVPELDDCSPDEMRAALEMLRQHLANALSRLRKQAWPTAEAPRHGTDEQRELLDKVLRMLLGEEEAPPRVMMPCAAGGEIALDKAQLEPIDPSRTLQENVYQRVRYLFAAANGGNQTQLQVALEVDLDSLRKDYAQTPGAGSDEPLLVSELLGNPKLEVLTEEQEIAVVLEPLGDARVSGQLNSRGGTVLRKFLAEYYLHFDAYDQISFPLYYDTGTGEPSTVEVVRVSPEDAPSLINESKEDRRKLAGTQLFNFGGFLDAQWRRNDIMWGRLDGCERLLATLLPDDSRLRGVLLEEAQRAILREEMSVKAHDELVKRFADVLVGEGKATLKQAFDGVWEKLGTDDAQRGNRTAMALQAMLGDAGLLAYVRQHYEVDRHLEPEPALKSASRAITITGQVLEDIEKRDQRNNSLHSVWITRGGRAFQALLAVATPGSMTSKVWSHWLALLYLFETLVFAGAVLLSEPLIRNFAFAAFALTLSLHVATLVSGDLMRGGRHWLRRIAVVLVLATLLLAGLGAVGLATVGVKPMLCGRDTPLFTRTGLPRWICGTDSLAKRTATCC